MAANMVMPYVVHMRVTHCLGLASTAATTSNLSLETLNKRGLIGSATGLRLLEAVYYVS